MDIIKNANELIKKNHLYGENNSTLKFVDDAILIENRKAPYDSPAVRANSLLGDHGAYRMAADIKVQGEGEFPFVATFKLTVEYLDLQYTTYQFSAQRSLTANEWQHVEDTIEIPAGSKLVSLIAYFVQRGSEEVLPDLLVKNFTVEKAEVTTTVVSRKDKKQIKRQAHTTVGAIRWDAYNITDTENSYVSNQVARALSEYPENAPYFSKIDENGKIHFEKATQEQFDTEAKLAIDAGIDYFAYCWYKDSSAMAYARDQHLASKFKNQIKMCAILGVSAYDDETILSLARTMKDDCYLKFDMRPVVYLYDAFRFDMALIKKLENAMKDCGISEVPYYIGMAHMVSPFIINCLANKGIDAIGAYACIQKEDVEPFKTHSKNVLKENDEKYQYYENIDIVPLISCGRDSRPRIKNPVSWAGNYGGKYIVQPTFSELYEHTSTILNKMAVEEEKNIPNTALIYAWNEHDEGAWCCPTLTMEDNKVVYNDDGTVKMNTLFLDALKKAIKDNKK